MLSWRWLLMQAACQPVCLADPNAGSKRAASRAIIAITTSSSIKVNPLVAFAAVRVFTRTSILLLLHHFDQKVVYKFTKTKQYNLPRKAREEYHNFFF
jgi:hypothetical protein